MKVKRTEKIADTTFANSPLFFLFAILTITKGVIVWITVNLRPKATEKVLLQNANIMLTGKIPSMASSWRIQCPEMISGLRNFPALAVSKGPESSEIVICKIQANRECVKKSFC